MSKLDKLFNICKQQQRLAFIPFVVLNDPDYETSLRICQTLVDGGADALELGFAFSDPLLDGQVIQDANKRALDNNATVDKNFKLLKEIRSIYPDLPLSLLLCANLIVQRGIDTFYKQAKDSGVDAILVADVPLIYSQEFIEQSKNHSIDHIFLCPPNASDEHLKLIAKQSSGFIYLVSRVGITSANDNHIDPKLKLIVNRLKELNAPAIVRGFGVSSPNDVLISKDLGVQGVICGSRIVKIIEDNLNNKDKLFSDLNCFIKKMKSV